MGLNKPQLIAAIKQAYKNRMIPFGTPNAWQEAELTALATDLGNAIDTFVKQAQVDYSGGLQAGGDPVTGTLNHTIS